MTQQCTSTFKEVSLIHLVTSNERDWQLYLCLSVQWGWPLTSSASKDSIGPEAHHCSVNLPSLRTAKGSHSNLWQGCSLSHHSMAWAINITSHTHSRWCLWRLMRLKISFMYSFFSPFVKHGHQFCHVKPWEIHPNGDLIYLFVISPGDALQPMPTLLRIGYHIVPFE